MCTKKSILAALFALGFAGATAFAQADKPRTDRDRYDGGSRVIKSKTIVGYKVKNAAGEDLGKIEELAIDPATGRIAYAVLSFGGFLGLGDKLFAIPWNALEPRHGEEVFILNTNKEELKNAPGFDKNNWPDMADRKWGQGIHDFYRSTPYWEDTGARSVRAEAKKLSLDLDEGKVFVFQVDHDGGAAARSGVGATERSRPGDADAPRSTTETPRSTTDTPRAVEAPGAEQRLGKEFDARLMTVRIQVQDAPAIAGDTTLVVTAGGGAQAGAPTAPPTEAGEHTKVYTVKVDSSGRLKSFQSGLVGKEGGTVSTPAAPADSREAMCRKILQTILGSGLHQETLQPGRTYDVSLAAEAAETSTETRPAAEGGQPGGFHQMKSCALRYDGLTGRGNVELARFSILSSGAGFSPASSRTEGTTRREDPSAPRESSREGTSTDTARAGEGSPQRALAAGQAVGHALYRVEDGVLEELWINPGAGASATSPQPGAAPSGTSRTALGSGGAFSIRRLQ